ncbi:hypothetical protein IAR55_005666 [Kwoniella newhampshirensis]|uniref:RNA polymerase II degradation factor 1 n=1 Tax=Kwoniella newhampshirensis TaxID=1651941 RepID=A0AAW0YUJ2_9TREE
MASVDELAVKYSSQLSQLQAIFPTWDEEDLVYTLQDVKGNVEEAAVMITEGRAAQFTQASRKKPVKSKDTSFKAHSNRNADTGGWEAVNGDEGRGSRGGRGGRGGARGGRGGRGGEPLRGGRGGRGGFRGGRGGLANVNGHAKPTSTEGPTTTATTEEGWASQVEQASSSADAQEADNIAPAETSNNEDFSGSGGWGDAPAPKEIEKAAKTGGKGWQKELDKPVPVASSTVPSVPAAKPKLTWAQIAKPVEKPKPAPPPAPVVPETQPEPEPEITSDEPVAQDEVEVAPDALEETAEEPVKAWGDAPAPEEVEEEATAVEPEASVEEAFTSPSAEDLLPEEPAAPQESSDVWESDPAIAGSGAQPDWTKNEPQQTAALAAPEAATTYQGPPGFSSVIAKAAPGVQAAQQPRSSSRAAQRYKDAEGQGVVLPPTAGGLSSMEMQFGSLSFGGLNGDGVDSPVTAPEPKQLTPAQAAPLPVPAPVAVSPVRSTQHTVSAPSAQPQQQAAAPNPASAPSAPYYQQQLSAQSQAPQPQPPQAYTAPHQTLQQQMQAYQYLQQQQAPAQTHSQDHGLHQPQGNQFYRQQDFYNPVGSQPQPTEAQGQQSQQQQQSTQQQQQASSPYDAPFGAFGQQSHLFGQSAQQQNQHSQTNDPYGAAHRSYDSYSASGYPRPPVEEPKPAAPAPSHTPTASAQPPHQQSGYYSQMGNMGYYQQGPYNPYYQYGQAPQAGFQQYYPLAARNLYGQPAPQAPPAPIPQSNKPQAPPAQSPYGAPPSYPSSASYDEQSFGGLGRYGDSKAQQAGQVQSQGAQTAGAGGAQNSLNSASPYNSQSAGGAGLHNFLGNNAISAPGSGAGASQASRPQAATPEDGFKSAPGVQARPQGNNNVPQAQGGQGFGSYPYGGGYGGQDWGQYGGQQYGSRNGYSHWQQ